MSAAAAKAIQTALRIMATLAKDENGKFSFGKFLCLVLLIVLIPLILIAVIIFIVILPFGAVIDLIVPENISYANIFPQNEYYENIGDYPYPCDSTTIRSDYGKRDNPLSPGNEEWHTGVDLAATWHSPVIAIGDGTVQFVGYKEHYGRCVVVEYDDFTAYYGHLAKDYAIRGQAVTYGNVLGTVGGDKENDSLAGDSTGPHLHFEIRIKGKTADPIPWLTEKNKIIETEDKKIETG